MEIEENVGSIQGCDKLDLEKRALREDLLNM